MLRSEVEGRGSNWLMILSRSVYVNDSTVLTGKHNKRITWDDVKLGVVAEAEAKEQMDGSLLGSKVWANVTPSRQSFELTGKISQRTSRSVTVNGKKFVIMASTEIKDRSGKHLRLSDLKVGMKVKVEYWKTGNTLTALQVRVV